MSREFIIADLLGNERVAQQCAADLIPVIREVFWKRLGRFAPVIPEIVIKVSENLPEGKVGTYSVPNEMHPEGILTIHPQTFTGGKTPYWYVVAHEMIHAFLGPESESHKGDFYAIAEELGIPEEYRD